MALTPRKLATRDARRERLNTIISPTSPVSTNSSASSLKRKSVQASTPSTSSSECSTEAETPSKKKKTTVASSDDLPVRVKQEFSPTESKPEVKPSQIIKNVYGNIVNIFVPIPNEKTTQLFQVHHGRLCQASVEFKVILAGTFKDDNVVAGPEPGSLLINNVDPATFQRFVQWLYEHKLTMEGETLNDLVWDTIIDLYLFATKQGISKLQNHCIDATINKQEFGKVLPNQKTMNKLWTGNTNVSHMRELFLHLYAYKCDLVAAIANNGNFHHRFLQGLVTTQYTMNKKKKLNKEINFWERRHKYYVFGEDNPVMVSD